MGEFVAGEGSDDEVKRASGDRPHIEADVCNAPHDDDINGAGSLRRQFHDVRPDAVREMGLGENQVGGFGPVSAARASWRLLRQQTLTDWRSRANLKDSCAIPGSCKSSVVISSDT